MLAAMTLTIAIELIVGPFTGLDPGFQVIGFIIPGLIANEVFRQRAVPTLSTLGIVSAITAGITILLLGFLVVRPCALRGGSGPVGRGPRGSPPDPHPLFRGCFRGEYPQRSSFM